MTSLLVTGIGELVTNDAVLGDGSPLGLLARRRLRGRGRARSRGSGPAGRRAGGRRAVDVGGAAVIPGFVDSHAHLVFAGDRAEEFAARMEGRPYSAGGIRTTVAATRAAPETSCSPRRPRRLVAEMARQGTTTVEIKSGYGLTVEDEARALAIARELTTRRRSSGRTSCPPEFADDAAGYVDLVTGPMLDGLRPTRALGRRLLRARRLRRGPGPRDPARRREAGLLARVHANQLGHGPGIAVACEVGAAAADHCTFLRATRTSRTCATPEAVATLLPGVEFSTRSPYPDARACSTPASTVALATDCNPGSCYTSSMPLCIALAVREMRMTPAEAMWSATAGGAPALRRTDIGHLAVGARADFAVLAAPSYLHLAYRPGVPLVAATYRGGRPV